jgi:UPF0755 protein
MENFSESKELGYLPGRPHRYNVFYKIGGAVLLVIFYITVLSAPGNFPVGGKFSVQSGDSLRSVSSRLKEADIIRSRVAFEFFIILFGHEKKIVSADYTFDSRVPVFEVARRIGGGEARTAPISVTIPEGFDVEQIADTFALKLPSFNKENFLAKAGHSEGYLFPDTYFFLSFENEDVVFRSMSENYEKKIAPLRKEIEASGKTEKDIIIMASVIEREAKGDHDRDVISGILWRRQGIGMALQVDAAPDTYKTKGLPPEPISNPGLAAIRAALHPKSSPYLYYLHDKNGDIHYAETFIGHTRNVAKYLR